jgi:uncharacterized protein YxjI
LIRWPRPDARAIRGATSWSGILAATFSQQVAQVRHAGFLGDKYDIHSAYGILAARGHFAGGDYTLSRDGVPVARMVRQFALREKFAIEVPDDENQVFFLAVVLAIEAIHDERNQQARQAGGFH